MLRRAAWMEAMLAVGLAGCTSHVVWDGRGIEATAADKPAVVVTSDVQMIRRTPRGFEPAVDITVTPSLPVSFKRALERYTDSANVRIMSAEMTVDTRLNSQYVSLTMGVFTNGQPYNLRCDGDTSSAGFGNKYLQELPVYLDNCARQLAQRLPT